jgi:hypothetical protein
MCPTLGLGRSSAARDRIGEGNFAFHAVGEGTMVAGGGFGCGQGNGVTVRAGLQLGDGERGKTTWRTRGVRRCAWSARLGFGDRENLFLAVFVTLPPPFSQQPEQRTGEAEGRRWLCRTHSSASEK